MVDWIRRMWHKYFELINYLFFGVLATLVNIVSYAVLADVLHLSTFWSTTIAWIISVLFAYGTNRTWVFRSKTTGRAAFREFYLFIGCRLFTYFTDVVFMLAAVDWYGASHIPAEWQSLWGIGAKVVSNVIVVILNYVFSKLIIFRKKKEE